MSAPVVMPRQCPEDFFPLPAIRNKQAKALDFIGRMVERGFKDIIVSAPTGVGKSAIGIAAGLWAAQEPFPVEAAKGAYYLCTQKMLQDQLENDITRYPPHLSRAVSIKSSTSYECRAHGSCAAGLSHQPICQKFRERQCTYSNQLARFLVSDCGITNYPWFFTCRTFNEDQLPTRRLLIADECHTLENQLLQFVEVVVGPDQLEKYARTAGPVPNLRDLDEFGQWLAEAYLPDLESTLEKFGKNLTSAQAREKQELQSQAGKVLNAVKSFVEDPDNWVFWTEEGAWTGYGNRTAFAKPLYAAGFFQQLIESAAKVRIYMSAYPGSKDVFCRTLGLDPSRTAMLTLGSVFPVEHRPIFIAPIGSMGRREQEATLPRLLKVLVKILNTHKDEKGIIHCNSYKLGKAIYEHLSATTDRVLFPTKAQERDNVYKFHLTSPQPTVIISPSFTEGFDFIGDSARWQVIAKVPYPYLGDRQVAAKRDVDPAWYAMRTVMTIVQASGRICRSEEDYGTTYVTDSDFRMLWRDYEEMFPAWWRAALKWIRQ